MSTVRARGPRMPIAAVRSDFIGVMLPPCSFGNAAPTPITSIPARVAASPIDRANELIVLTPLVSCFGPRQRRQPGTHRFGEVHHASGIPRSENIGTTGREGLNDL